MGIFREEDGARTGFYPLYPHPSVRFSTWIFTDQDSRERKRLPGFLLGGG